jgi:predicted GIY-YIG superfamily endonuclease
MKTKGNIFKRLVYMCEFIDNHVYIGLTCNSERRNIEHTITDTDSSVHKYILKTGLYPEYKELTDYVDVEIAIKLEKDYIKKYEELGYILLNRKQGGGLGGGRIKWTYENCKNEALNYPTRTLFCKYKGRAYRKSKAEGWIDDFYPNNLLQ